jgi:outer membrane protein assembly factor BamD (BamD/ComL family)
MAGCSVEKNTGTTRFYQGMTSRYNIYFNGIESFKAGIERIENGYIDDFSGILKIFEYSDPSTQPMCAADMESAIAKASKVISLKSISAKPEVKGNEVPSAKDEEFMNRKEYNEWVDDSYLLMGKARLYKRDYELSKSTFNFNLTLSVDPKIKTESTIWLARVYNETGNFNESSRILNELDLTAKEFTKELKEAYYTTVADRLVKQKRYNEAVDPLSNALNNVSGKRSTYRLTYILAQLCEKTGDGKRATELYRKVVKLNPPYDFEFNARINMAGVFDINTGNPNSIKKELEKMLRNSKNKEFLDQIYFALGNLYMKEGLEEDAIQNYKNSAQASTVNRSQRTRSYLALAEYYYTKPDYINSGSYYDSALLFIDSKYPDYDQIKTKSLNLNTLVGYLNTIQREDSLQRVAKMSEQERTSLIASIIEKAKEDEKNKKPGESSADRYNLGQYYENERRFQGNIDQEGKWYFYNQSAMTFGRTEFRRRWGDRKLEDNWRRQNKTRLANVQPGVQQEENGQVKVDSTTTQRDLNKPEFYMRDLPLTDSLLSVSNDKIAGSYLESGKIYSDKFQDNVKAVGSFEKLIERFPGEMYEPEALYNIYKIYVDENNQNAQLYKDKLVQKYPDNEFTKIITDPAYFSKLLESRNESEKLYNSAYDAYQKEDFPEALAICNRAVVQFSKDELIPKFMLLKSYCIAKTADERTFKESLNTLVKAYPSTPESAKAAEIIAFLNNKIPELKVEEDKQIASEIYVDEMDSQHTFVIIIQNPSFNLNQAIFDVISYNIDNYTNKNLRTQGSLVNDKFIMLTVSGFQKTDEAMEYYRSFSTLNVIRNPSDSKIISFITGKANLETFQKDKNPDRYLLFFRERYLNEEIKK